MQKKKSMQKNKLQTTENIEGHYENELVKKQKNEEV